jgi:hypothetical protein
MNKTVSFRFDCQPFVMSNVTQNYEKRDHLKLDVGGRIVLKWMLKQT